MVFLIFFSYITYGRNIKMKYKKRYDMKRLAIQERVEWPQINPVLELDLAGEDLDSGPWAMGMNPVMFCKHNKLIEISLMPQTFGSSGKGPKFKATLNKAKADTTFIRQLGRMWRGPEKLPLHRRALLAAFIARGMRDTKAAQGLIMQINRSAISDHSKELDFTGADELWQKHYNSKQIQTITHSHAYEFTFFVGIFLFARQDGVFPTSDFLWLKPRDRSFWYVLNSVGRQTPGCESAGVFAHFLAEKSLGRPLSVPMIGEATKALQFALDEIIYTPSEEEKEKLLATAANEANG
jgi:intracellular multiplication protein IcmP